MRIPVQVSLDGEIIRKLREQKVNISELVNKILKHMMEADSLSAESLALAMLKSERESQLQLIDMHIEQMNRIRQMICITDEKIKKQETVIVEIQKSERIAELMRDLNESLITLTFEEAKALPVLEKLRAEGIPVSDAWLTRHMKRIEALGR